jgi:hypothetical protein
MLDSPEDVCAGQARFEYPATFVLFSMRSHAWDSWSLKQIIFRLGVHRIGPSPRLGGERRLVCRRTGDDDVPAVLHVARRVRSG